MILYYELVVVPEVLKYPEMVKELEIAAAHGILKTGMQEGWWPTEPPKKVGERWTRILPCLAHKMDPDTEIEDCTCSFVEMEKGHRLATNVRLMWEAPAAEFPETEED